MNGSSNSEGSVHAADDQPEWALFTGMPEKPVEAGESDFGFIDSKGVTSTASCVNDLAEKIGKSRESVDLVWTPDSERMQVTEEVPALNKVIWCTAKAISGLELLARYISIPTTEA